MNEAEYFASQVSCACQDGLGDGVSYYQGNQTFYCVVDDPDHDGAYDDGYGYDISCVGDCYGDVALCDFVAQRDVRQGYFVEDNACESHEGDAYAAVDANGDCGVEYVDVHVSVYCAG